tara:strand:- start:1836 stop:2516 length:681 start_codon:yes stop_codon:yes gene_type:complete
MPNVKIDPSKDKPVPYDLGREKPATVLEKMAVAANTVELQEALGSVLDLQKADLDKEKNLIEDAIKRKKTQNLSQPNTAFAAAAFLRTYGQQLAMDAAQARAAITNKLMEIANCGDARYELKALELLGKHSDIGIFTERSEITINYKNPVDLENEIKERVKRLLNASLVETVSLDQSLDEDLGIFESEPSMAEELEDLLGAGEDEELEDVAEKSTNYIGDELDQPA